MCSYLTYGSKNWLTKVDYKIKLYRNETCILGLTDKSVRY